MTRGLLKPKIQTFLKFGFQHIAKPVNDRVFDMYGCESKKYNESLFNHSKI